MTFGFRSDLRQIPGPIGMFRTLHKSQNKGMKFLLIFIFFAILHVYSFAGLLFNGRKVRKGLGYYVANVLLCFLCLFLGIGYQITFA